MSDGIPYADIVILALVAGFILLRLRSVLGSKSDNDTPNFMKRVLPAEQSRPAVKETVIQLDSLKAKPKEEIDPYFAALPDSSVRSALNDIQLKDAQFSPSRFLQGAKAAFEMVFDAFAKGDTATLKMLMSDDIFKTFNAEIANRAAHPDHKSEITLVSVAAKDITQAALYGSTARLTVHFASEQINLVRNAAGEIIEGNASDVHHVEDDWVFERDTSSKNPNWKIIET